MLVATRRFEHGAVRGAAGAILRLGRSGQCHRDESVDLRLPVASPDRLSCVYCAPPSARLPKAACGSNLDPWRQH